MASNEFRYNDTECPVCMETFKDPKLLPCTHTYCLQHIEKIAGGRKTFSCPECNRDTVVPSCGLQALPGNRYIHGTLRVIEQAKQWKKEKLQAEKLLKVKLQREKLQAKEEMGQQSQPILYCDDCQQMVRAICGLIKHKRHEIVEIAEKYVDVKEHIKKVINDVEYFSAKYSEYLKKLDETEKEVKESAKVIIGEIDKKQEKMIKQIKHVTENQKLEVLQIEEQNINKIQIVKMKLLEFTKLLNDFSTNNLSDIDNTSMHELLASRNNPADTLSTIKLGIFNENVDISIVKVTYIKQSDETNHLSLDHVEKIESKMIYVHPGVMPNITLQNKWNIGKYTGCISYSKDNDCLLASGDDNGLDIINCFTSKGQMVWQVYTGEHAIVTDGTEHLVGVKEHKIELFNLTDGAVLDTINIPFVAGYWYEGCVVCAVGDKSFLVVNSSMKPNSLAKFEIRNGKRVNTNVVINTDLWYIDGIYYCSDRGEVFVICYTQNTIEAIDYTTHDMKWKITGQCDGRMISPSGVTGDERGSLYVADGDNNRVLTIRDGRAMAVLQNNDCPSEVFGVL